MEHIVDKFLLELQDRIDRQKVKLKVTPQARKWLATRGYDPRFGARPLARLIETEIAKVLADELLFGRLSKGGEAIVDLKDEALNFSLPTEKSAPTPGTAGSELEQ
jgi:ATP-dependent Clp protease ATP-binding subunit ClpA